MIAWNKNVGILTLVVVLASACGSDADTTSPTQATPATSAPGGNDTTDSVESTMAPLVSTEQAPAQFPVANFSAISEDPVTEELAAEFQAALAMHDVADGGGMSATVMTAEGTWSGTTGKADGVRDLQVDDQFPIASITKSVVAAQVMLMVEAGELGLDDLLADHLPADLDFDTNGATIRQLLSHRSGIPDYYNLLYSSQQTDFQRVWTPTEILDLLPTRRTPPGSSHSYAETNYLLLKLVIEHLRGRPLAEVVRDGALATDGLERLVYQPDESPSEPIAMPAGASHDVLEGRGGYLPSLASATAYHASGAIASDSPSLARWWRALCAGEIVSQASLTEMSRFEPAQYVGSYGLGVYNPARGYAEAFGHMGQLPGYMSWAACVPEDQAVIVVLTNHEVDDGHLAFSQGLARPLVDALRARTPVVARDDDGGTQIDSVTPTGTTAAPARDALGVRGGPGRYFVDPDGDDATPLRVTFEVATDNLWSWFGWVKYLPGEADGFTGLSITTVTNLVTQGCEDHRPLDPPVGPTVDDLAMALSQLAPFEVTAPPSDVTLFGYHGKHLELTVPALPVTGGGPASSSKNIAQFTDCDMGEIHNWISPINDRSAGLLAHSTAPFRGAFNAYQTPGQTEEFWILDVQGTRLVLVSFDTPNAPADDIAERDAVFDTIRIEP